MSYETIKNVQRCESEARDPSPIAPQWSSMISRRALLLALGAAALPVPAKVGQVEIGVCGSIADFEKAEQFGFDYFEPAVAALAALSDDAFADFAKRVSKSRLRCECFNSFIRTLTVVGPAVDNAALTAYMNSALDRCRTLGATIVVWGSAGSRNVPEGFSRDRAWQQMVSFLRMAGPIAQARNIVIAIEPLRKQESNIINSGAEAFRLVREVDHPNVKMIIDYYHLAQEHEDPQILRAGARRYSAPAFRQPQRPRVAQGSRGRPGVRAVFRDGQEDRFSRRALHRRKRHVRGGRGREPGLLPEGTWMKTSDAPVGARTVRKEWAAEWDLTNEEWKAPRFVMIEEFRPDGKLLVSEMRNPDGSVCRSVNSYDDAGLLTATEFQNGATSSTSVTVHDDRGRLIRRVGNDPDGSERVGEEYVYAADGSYTRVMYLPHMEGNVIYGSFIDDIDYSFSAPGTVATMTTAFDSQGRASESLVKDAEGSVLRRLVLTRDEAGRLVKDELFLGAHPMFPDVPMFGSGASLVTTEYTYDERGRRVEMVRRMFGLSEQRETTQYDDHGNWTKTTSNSDHREAQVHEGGVELGAATVNRQQSRCTHTFDARGNWTERVTSQRYGENPDFTPCAIDRREIAYYD